MEELWYTKKAEEVLKAFRVDPRKGLSRSEISDRQEKLGKNTLPVRSPNPWWMIVARQFASPLVYILLLGVLIGVYTKEYVDASVVLGAVIINAVIGFFQEYKADRALRLIQASVVFSTLTIREEKKIQLPIDQLVAGDIIELQAGDRVPADARIIHQINLRVNEAILTGESLPVKKGDRPVKKGTALGARTSMVYLGTSIIQGVATAVVVATGPRTEFGHIAELLRETAEQETPLQVQIRKLARLLALIFAGLSVIFIIIGLIEHRPLEMLLTTSIAVAVASIPEGLLMSVTVVLIVGMRRILKQNAIVKRLVAAETLGAVSVVCTDKTGTLTMAEMTPVLLIHGPGEPVELDSHPNHLEFWTAGIVCNNAYLKQEGDKRTYLGDPTETALLRGAEKTGLAPEVIQERHLRLFELPFDTKEKYMAVLTKEDGEYGIWVKGAPEVILDRSTCYIDKTRKPLSAEMRLRFLHEAEKLTAKGYRLLGLATKDTRAKKSLLRKDIGELCFLGIVALKDPLRPDAKGVIQQTVNAGIRPILVTGDHKGTARAIMHELGLPSAAKYAMTGEELDELTDAQFAKALRRIWIYARVEPRHKVRIVDAWKKEGEVVAMLGDGINDAPSLKAADIGLALGSGTDVAKETADIVLTDDNFKVILEAIKEGRAIFQNIQKVVVFFLSDSLVELLLLGIALIAHWPFPILAGQILWINIVEDIFPAVALAFEKRPHHELAVPAKRQQGPLVTNKMKVYIGLVSAIGAATVIGSFLLFQPAWESNLPYVHTIVFVILGINSLLLAFSARSLFVPIWKMNPFGSLWLNLSFLAGFGMILVGVYVPSIQTILKTEAIRLEDWWVPALFAVIQIGFVEIVKYFFIIRREAYDKRNKNPVARG